MKKSASNITKQPAEIVATTEPFKIRIQKSQAHFKRIRNPNGADQGVGTFLLFLDITAVEEILYIPISIASGKKPTGFIYQIEGTATGDISTTDISCKGEGVTQITLGTILYAKIPKGMTATFRVLVEIKGHVGKTYKVVISRIHYKRDPSDARYERYSQEISTRPLEFR